MGRRLLQMADGFRGRGGPTSYSRITRVLALPTGPVHPQSIFQAATSAACRGGGFRVFSCGGSGGCPASRKTGRGGGVNGGRRLRPGAGFKRTVGGSSTAAFLAQAVFGARAGFGGGVAGGFFKPVVLGGGPDTSRGEVWAAASFIYRGGLVWRLSRRVSAGLGAGAASKTAVSGGGRCFRAVGWRLKGGFFGGVAVQTAAFRAGRFVLWLFFCGYFGGQGARLQWRGFAF